MTDFPFYPASFPALVVQIRFGLPERCRWLSRWSCEIHSDARSNPALRRDFYS